MFYESEAANSSQAQTVEQVLPYTTIIPLNVAKVFCMYVLFGHTDI